MVKSQSTSFIGQATFFPVRGYTESHTKKTNISGSRLRELDIDAFGREGIM